MTAVRNFDGVASTSQTPSGEQLGSQAIGVNNTTPDLMNRIGGKMDLHSQFGNMDGDFSILGSKKTGAPVQTTRAVVCANVVWDKKEGLSCQKMVAVFPESN